MGEVIKGLAIQEAVQELHLNSGIIRKTSSAKKAIEYGEKAASRYMENTRKQKNKYQMEKNK